MIQEKEATVREALEWLASKIQSQGIIATLRVDQMEIRQTAYYTFAALPVIIQNTEMDTYAKVKLLAQWEGAWNDQEPRPTYLLTLLPPGLPEGVW